jgi:hypothetical protein
MTTAAPKDWIVEFGLGGRKPPEFFSSVDQLDDVAGKVPQPHALRRAFEDLGVEGVLCQGRSPVIYFRQVGKIDPDRILDLHRSFWNQGIAPILVVIAPDEVHVYSGLATPEGSPAITGDVPGLVEKLARVRDGLRSFLLSVESGEYFHVHRRSFDPRQRVDRELLRNLQATRQKLGEVEAARLEPQTLDALLCRLVFTCYLFDRGVIDEAYLKSLRIHSANHLKDILATKPRTAGKSDLYTLFAKLGEDFNGDLFSADLESESKQVKVDHLDILDLFFHGADVRSGQQSFWPYDFRFIPIETISAIYEHFLKAAGDEQKREAGAFYTPRFLAEFVLDVALEGETSLLDKRFLDPACGSGIFLVGLFNRLAEEWKLKNPGARYDRRATGLMDILRSNLYGVDSNRSACQITAFSLYLAFLDQLSPPDIRKLLGKWDRLPYLVFDPSEPEKDSPAGTIRYADFFSDGAALPQKAHLIVGNPPWGSSKDRNAPAVQWVAERKLPHPDRQMASAFIWKAPEHLEGAGRVCFLVPHGTLFNHSEIAVRFQQSFFRRYAVDRVVNLTDFRMFLFADSKAGSLVMRYGKEKPVDSAHVIDYWAPKTDWAITQAEIMTIVSQDRSRLTVCEVLDGLRGGDGPRIWKEHFWATPRDRQLLERLSHMARLRNIVDYGGERSGKRWFFGQGFKPERGNVPKKDANGSLLSKARPWGNDAQFLRTKARGIDLFVLESDCVQLGNQFPWLHRLPHEEIFEPPHVLVTKGFRAAYCDFHVVFRHALQGLHGPKEDRELLMFLAAYLRSGIAKFFQFHTSSSWGIYRPEIHVEELLRLPFPLPDDSDDPKRCWAIVQEVAMAVTNAMKRAAAGLTDREGVVRSAYASIENLIEEYFDIDAIERALIADASSIVIPSIQPSRSTPNIPTLKQSSQAFRDSYTTLLCDRLNGWAKQEYRVHAKTLADSSIGVGMVVLEKTKRDEKPKHLAAIDGELLKVINGLQHTAAKKHGTFEIVRGLKVFWKNLLYITKPLGQRFWTSTAALNDADEIAATILTRSDREGS